MLKVSKIKLIVAVFIIICVGVSYRLHNRVLVIPDSESLKPPLSRYDIKPSLLLDFSNDQIGYPYVSKQPGSLTYSLLDIAERYQLFTNQKDRLFFANKRVAEIIKWGSELKTSGEVDSTDMLMQNSYPLDSWESIISSYYKLMLESLEIANAANDEFADDSLLFETQKHIVVHERDIKEYLEDTDLQNKNYLINLFQLVFSDLKAEVGILPLDESDMETRMYGMNEIILNRDYGEYDISINQSAFRGELTQNSFPKISVGGLEYTSPGTEDNYFHYEGMKIDDELKTLGLSFELDNKIRNSNRVNDLPSSCFEVKNEYQNDPQIFRLETIEISEQYLMNIRLQDEADLSEVLIVSVGEMSCEIRSRKTFDNDSVDDINVNLYVNYEETGEHYLVFISEDEIKVDDILLAREIYPTIILQKQHNTWVPEINITKISKGKYNVNLKNANNYQLQTFKSGINFPYRVVSQEYDTDKGYVLKISNRPTIIRSLLLGIFVLLSVYLIYRLRKLDVMESLNKVENYIIKIKKRLSLFEEKKAIVLSSVAIPAISIVDIYYISSTIDPIFILPISLLFLTALVYNFSHRMFIISGLIYFLLAVVMYMIDHGNYIGGPVDKATYWAYYFLLFGVMLMVVRSIGPLLRGEDD